MRGAWSPTAALVVAGLSLPAMLWLALVLPPVKPAAGPSTARQEQGMLEGQSFVDPPDAVASGDGARAFELDAREAQLDVAGRSVSGAGYNAAFVGPTLHLQPGQDATIALVNHLQVATNLHFHGLHVAPTENSDNSFVCVAPGQRFVYHLRLPSDHPIGTFWYHSHAMGRSCPDASPAMPGMPGMVEGSESGETSFTPGDVENQVIAGLSGAIVVGDNRTLLPPDFAQITAHTLVLKDVQIDTDGQIVQSTTTPIDSNSPTVRLVNGQLRPRLPMRPGETQLWRLVNAGADIFYQLQLDGTVFSVVGEDGRPVDSVRAARTLLLPPAKRYDVLVTAPSEPGTVWLRSTPFSSGPQGDSYPNVPLASINVDGVPEAPPAKLQLARPGPLADLTTATIAQRRTLTLSEKEQKAGGAFYINDRQFSMDSSIFDTPAELNTVEEWTILNQSGEDHPFHLHTNAFQVMSMNGTPEDYTHVADTVSIPHAVKGVPGVVVVRIPFRDYVGPWMFHCHIAAHEDHGVMSFVDVVLARAQEA